MDLSRTAQRSGPEYDRVSSALYGMARNLDRDDPYTTVLSNQLDEVDAEYRRIRVASSMRREAGRGLELPEVYQAIFGNSASAKAFRSLVTHMKDNWYKTSADYPPEVQVLAAAALPTVRAMRTSQALKTAVGEHARTYGVLDVPFREGDPVLFAAFLGWFGLRDLKRFLAQAVGRGAGKPVAAAWKFLHEWVNTNVRRMPAPSREVRAELAPYRPDGPMVLYRGVRFHDVGELVEFTRQYADTGNPFPFMSDWWSSWTKSKTVAERFGRYRGATSHNDAMLGWLHRVKANKPYDGRGGYVIGALVRPEQCLVDVSKVGVNGQHGNEQEVIVNPGAKLTCKVYAVFGDVAAEVTEFRSNKYESGQTPEQIARGTGTYGVDLVSVDGDIATYAYDASPYNYAGMKKDSTPRAEAGPKILDRFRSYLYDAEWIDDYRVRFRPMDFGDRLASAWGRVIVP